MDTLDKVITEVWKSWDYDKLYELLLNTIRAWNHNIKIKEIVGEKGQKSAYVEDVEVHNAKSFPDDIVLSADRGYNVYIYAKEKPEIAHEFMRKEYLALEQHVINTATISYLREQSMLSSVNVGENLSSPWNKLVYEYILDGLQVTLNKLRELFDNIIENRYPELKLDSINNKRIVIRFGYIYPLELFCSVVSTDVRLLL